MKVSRTHNLRCITFIFILKMYIHNSEHMNYNTESSGIFLFAFPLFSEKHRTMTLNADYNNMSSAVFLFKPAK